ncbi:MAG: YkgJ family cysteine cluster protein [Kiritimatiellae bacterium]|nr:YkgJ family cysteine cluster protein [Kiritimatiellia bacterium]
MQTKEQGEVLASALADFHCLRCGNCCRIPGIVRLNDADISAIASVLKLTEEEFIEHHTDLSPDRTCLVLKNKEDGSCAQLTQDGLCRIHSVKPRQCQTFPYEWRNPDSAVTCPALRMIDAR